MASYTKKWPEDLKGVGVAKMSAASFEQLKEECKSRGLPVGRSRDTCIQRLQEWKHQKPSAPSPGAGRHVCDDCKSHGSEFRVRSIYYYLKSEDKMCSFDSAHMTCTTTLHSTGYYYKSKQILEYNADST